MAHYNYTTRGTCSRRIDFDIEDGKLHDIAFEGGCDGNLKAIGLLLEGADAREAAAKLRGNICGRRSTSCADQLARAIDGVLGRDARNTHYAQNRTGPRFSLANRRTIY